MEASKQFISHRKDTFALFLDRIQTELLTHRVITRNTFTAWFKDGNISPTEVKAFVVQFSVFSNLFLVAQLKKMINADSLEGMHASKEILANEIGVIFNPPQKSAKTTTDPDCEGDPELVNTMGTIEGGTFRFQAAHFEWLLKMASKLGLTFNELGKRRHSTQSTAFFCDELDRLYGSENYEISQAASFAVENWAAAGFWKELISGLTKYKEKHCKDLPLAFFTWHDRIEEQHAKHTLDELKAYYMSHPVNENNFIKYGTEMLDGIAVFWNGLDEQRKSL